MDVFLRLKKGVYSDSNIYICHDDDYRFDWNIFGKNEYYG